MVYDAKNNLGFYLSLSPFSFDFLTPTNDIVFLPKSQQPHCTTWPVIAGYITSGFFFKYLAENTCLPISMAGVLEVINKTSL